MPIYCRITLNRRRKQFSCGLFARDINWDVENSIITGHLSDAKFANDRIGSIRKKLLHSYNKLLRNEENIDVQDVYDQFIGKAKDIRTILGTFDYHIQQIKELIGKDYSPATYNKFVLIKKHLSEFISRQYHLNDIALTNLKLGFYKILSVRRLNRLCR